MTEKISIFVITKNEDDKLARCLEKLTWADELIIVDSYSIDKTVEIAKKYTKKIYTKKFEGYGQQKQTAIDHCTNQWVLEVDADEIVTETLKLEIQALLKNPEELNKYYAYNIERQEYFLGKPLMISEIPRLYRKDKVQYREIIHERLEIRGYIGKLKNKLIHEADKYNSIAKRLEKNNEYTKLEAERIKMRKTGSMWNVLARMIFIPIAYFLWLYLRKGLIWKGYRGLIWCILTMHYHFLVYAKVYEYIYKSRQPPVTYEKAEN